MSNKRIAIETIFIVILFFVFVFGLRNIFGFFGINLPTERNRLNRIICADQVYVVDDDSYAFRYDRDRKVLVIVQDDKVINCGIDYMIEKVWVKEEG